MIKKKQYFVWTTIRWFILGGMVSKCGESDEFVISSFGTVSFCEDGCQDKQQKWKNPSNTNNDTSPLTTSNQCAGCHIWCMQVDITPNNTAAVVSDINETAPHCGLSGFSDKLKMIKMGSVKM